MYSMHGNDNKGLLKHACPSHGSTPPMTVVTYIYIHGAWPDEKSMHCSAVEPQYNDHFMIGGA